jgi:hypothetical protein
MPTLSVAFVDEKAASCRIGLRMRNGLADGIDSIVLRFSAFTKDDILYETVSKGFHSLKPTNNQQQEISFRAYPAVTSRASACMAVIVAVSAN